MRRHERQIREKEELVDILQTAAVCRIAISTFSAPYIVPMNFGFIWNEKLELFFHCADAGRKLELLSVNNRVGFEIDCGLELVQNDKPCDWGMHYRSIIGTGQITIVDGDEDKKKALDSIMRHYKFRSEQIVYDDAVLRRTRVLRLMADELSGKKRV